MIASIQELLQKEAQAVLNIPVTDAYEKAVELIVEQVHRKRGNVIGFQPIYPAQWIAHHP